MSGIGCAMAGSGGVQFSLGIAPASQSLGGTTANKQFSAETVTITGDSAGATYNWTVTPNDEYSWSIVSGQGTSSCIAQVTGVVSSEGGGDPASGTLQCDVTVAGVTKSISASLDYTRA